MTRASKAGLAAVVDLSPLTLRQLADRAEHLWDSSDLVDTSVFDVLRLVAARDEQAAKLNENLARDVATMLILRTSAEGDEASVVAPDIVRLVGHASPAVADARRQAIEAVRLDTDFVEEALEQVSNYRALKGIPYDQSAVDAIKHAVGFALSLQAHLIEQVLEADRGAPAGFGRATIAVQIDADARRDIVEECAIAVEAHADHWPKIYEGGARLAIQFAAERVRRLAARREAADDDA